MTNDLTQQAGIAGIAVLATVALWRALTVRFQAEIAAKDSEIAYLRAELRRCQESLDHAHDDLARAHVSFDQRTERYERALREFANAAFQKVRPRGTT